MVYFSCDTCQETVKKPKVPRHLQICRTSSMSCVDCGTSFDRNSVKDHNSCVSEAEKYQGKLYQGPKSGSGAKTGGSIVTDVAYRYVNLERPPWKCDLCKVNCTGRENLESHCQAKKHINRSKRKYEEEQKAGNIGNGDEKNVSATKPEQQNESSGVGRQGDDEQQTTKANHSDKRKDSGEEIGVDRKKSKKRKSVEKENEKEATTNEPTKDKKAKKSKQSKSKTEDESQSTTEISSSEKSNSKSEDPKRQLEKVIKSTLKKVEGRKMKLKKLQKEVLKTLGDDHGESEQLSKDVKKTVKASSKFSLDEDKVVSLA